MRAFENFLQTILGLGVPAQDLTLPQLLWRTLIVCIVTLLMIRLAGRRFLAQKNPFDVMLAFIIASMMSRAINGSTTFFGTLALGIIMAVGYRTMAWAMCRWHGLGKLLKGEPEILVAEGKIKTAAMNRHHVSKKDLHEDARLSGGIDDLDKIKIAQLERSGDISIQRQPQVLELKVEKDVQTIRILIE